MRDIPPHGEAPAAAYPNARALKIAMPRSIARPIVEWLNGMGALPRSPVMRATTKPVQVLRELEEEFLAQRKCAHIKSRRLSLALALLLVALFGVVDGYVAPTARNQLWLIRFGVFVPTILMVLAITIANPLHRWCEQAVVFATVLGGACVAEMAVLAPAHFAGVLLIAFSSYTFLGLRYLHACTAGIAVSVIYGAMVVMAGETPWPIIATNLLFLASCNAIGAFVALVLERTARRDFYRTRVLSDQRQSSERLLHNVLPIKVAKHLKAHPGIMVESYAEATILFADIVDFTRYAASLTPVRLIRVLDEVFSRFDQLSLAHQLEKIKTIGDAYLVVGGLHKRRRTLAAAAVADMALDMLDAVRAFDAGDGQRLALRIGIHTGPVVAGVVGKTKLAYDMWGDSVNLASRLQSVTTPGTIQVSESTYERLRDQYVFSAGRTVAVKGRGEVRCYELLQRKSMMVRRVVDASRLSPVPRIRSATTSA